MDIQKQSTKFIKPATQTPPTLHHHKLGLIDECAPPFNISVVFFYAADTNNPNFVSHLEKSLEKTLPRFYPLAGRYLEAADRVIECLDQGVEFIHAKVTNVKYEEIVGSEENLKLVDQLIPSPLGAVDQVTDPLLSIQVTTFESGGGVALGVSISHRVGDTATLFIFLNEWAAITRGESQTDFPPGSGFNTASFFPARGSSTPKLFPRTKSSDNLYRNKYVTKKLSFSESEISNLKDKVMVVGSEHQQYFSKVQLVSAFIWKALSDMDQRTNGEYPPRCSVLLWAINLRGKSTSLIPSDSCGNLSTAVSAKCETNDETVESLARLVRNSVKGFMDSYSKVRDDKEQVQKMVIKSRSDAAVIPPNSTVIRLTSWCKFPYYQLDFGFGKPIWVNRGRAIGKNVVYLMDDAGGNGVEAYVGVETKDVPYFEEALLNIKAY
uniref:pelargonidin 3-O-(6-caffeoylglucoside) 5-O-(6-O-malonylglucoside) 4'''-malonyltransferase-like n=1 Tax=Erigeron canadensis TaxID=72917 RepID=UPI001CB9A701|nr:pelargonidin 3-O-(6-caffeoylglucoside) 5-O-(6-O-malonylglucoside) 4'''-malonyltransferase-like [Erigeron canadensis]